MRGQGNLTAVLTGATLVAVLSKTEELQLRLAGQFGKNE